MAPPKPATKPSAQRPSPMTSITMYVAQLKSNKCSGCRRSLVSSDKDVMDTFGQWTKDPGAKEVSSILRCKQCSASVCFGCGSKPGKAKYQAQTGDGKTRFTACCERGRIFVLWVLLCGLDQYYSFVKQAEKNASSKGSGSGAANRFGGRDTGVGYGGSSMPPFMMGGGFEYGGYGYQAQAQEQASNQQKQKAESLQAISDRFYHRVMTFLAPVLPSPDRKSTFDADPPAVVERMLLQSKVLNKAAELLRNDSLEDATKRKGLYQAVLNLVRIIGTHRALRTKTVFSERADMPDAANLLTYSFSGSMAKSQGTTSSLADCLRNLNIQSNMMLKSAKGNPQEFKTTEGQDMLWVCRNAYDLAQFLLANTKGGTGAVGVAQKQSQTEPTASVMELPDNQVIAANRFAQMATQAHSTMPGRMKRLVSEIANMKTSLPPGIFVRHGESRLDFMKILIVGPADTPYELGLFQFDLWCPYEYPHVSPKMLFRGTGSGGRVTINPNLHADGKVCLSLLGTWAGEPWRPGQSTILQVLVSVQAMIFCADPSGNVPGGGSWEGTPMATQYNASVCAATVQLAMLGWLGAGVNRMWSGVVAEHFKKNGAKIMQVVDRWASEGAGGMEFMNPRANMIRGIQNIQTLRGQLQTALQKYGVKPGAYQPSQAQPQIGGYGAPGSFGRGSGGGSALGGCGGFGAPPARGGRGGFGG